MDNEEWMGPPVPESQHQEMMKEIQKRRVDAEKRLRRAVDYTSRRNAEDDLAGLQALEVRIGTWKLVKKGE